MSSFLDFLFQGAPSPANSTQSQSITSYPQWYADDVQAMISKASSIAGQDYQPYSGPRVAGFTDPQQAAFQQVQDNQGSWKPDLAAARSGLQQASTGSFPDAAQSYMNPYISGVTDRIAQLGARNLSENLLPQVNDTFTGAGQFGGSRSADFTNRAVRDANESIMGQQAQALMQGYTQAGQQYSSDTARQLYGSQALGGLGQMQQNLGNVDAAGLAQIGQQQQTQNQQNLNTAYSNFLEQRNWPVTMLGVMNQAVRGVPVPTATQTSGQQSSGTYNPSGLAQIAGIGGTAGALGLFARGGKVAAVPAPRYGVRRPQRYPPAALAMMARAA